MLISYLFQMKVKLFQSWYDHTDAGAIFRACYLFDVQKVEEGLLWHEAVSTEML